MQTLCVSSNWPSVEALHPRQLDIFVHGWQDDCPPPDVNGAAPAVTAPAVPGQGVGAIKRGSWVRTSDGCQFRVRHVSKRGVATLCDSSGAFSRYSVVEALALA